MRQRHRLGAEAVATTRRNRIARRRHADRCQLTAARADSDRAAPGLTVLAHEERIAAGVVTGARAGVEDELRDVLYATQVDPAGTGLAAVRCPSTTALSRRRRRRWRRHPRSSTDRSARWLGGGSHAVRVELIQLVVQGARGGPGERREGPPGRGVVERLSADADREGPREVVFVVRDEGAVDPSGLRNATRP